MRNSWSDMEQYSYNNLSQIIGESVQLTDNANNTVDLKLKEITLSPINGEEWEAFSVLFEGDNEYRIPQGTFTFAHKVFGEVDLFMSPKSEVLYETVVSMKLA